MFKKLGLKEGQRIKPIHAPVNFTALIGHAMNSLAVENEATENLDFIQLFTNSVSELEALLPELKMQIRKSGSIWVSWYKKSAGKETQLTENVIREVALAAGLVDVKVCAVDDDWSGLKLVYRLKDR